MWAGWTRWAEWGSLTALRLEELCAHECLGDMGVLVGTRR